LSGSSGYGGIGFNPVITRHTVRAELYIDTSSQEANKRIFDKIKLQYNKLHDDNYVFSRMDGKRACRIFVGHNIGKKDKNNWPEAIEFLAAAMKDLYDTFKPLLDDVMRNLGEIND